MVFLSPAPSKYTLSQIYSTGYHSHNRSPESHGMPGTIKSSVKSLLLLPYRLRFGREDGAFAPLGQGRLLDIGCGTGDYLLAMSRRGWQCFGCDISEAALNAAHQKIPQATFFPGSFEALDLQKGSFEAITFWHTLEHLSNPLNTLRRARELLVPGGRLVVAVPNIESMESRILGIRWAEIDLPGHLFFFSPSVLSGLLEKAGFTLSRIRPQVHPSTVSDSVGFLLDDLLNIERSRQHLWLYYLLFPFTVISYILGNWGCIEVTAVKR